MIRCSLFCLLLMSPLWGGKSKYAQYLELLSSHKYTIESPGSFRNGEIEIVRQESAMKEIEDLMNARLLKEGYSKKAAEEGSRIGILCEDKYWIWVRDGVIFPTGAKGTYNRIIWKREMTDEVPRVAMLPVLANKKIVLNLNYRHALRKWVLELPRGYKRENEPNEEAARRQLKEETGYTASQLIYLGSVSPDSGSFSSSMPVYFMTLGKKDLSNQEYSEAILRLEEFSLQELKQILANGVSVMKIHGKPQEVGVCDAYLAYAILQAEMKGLFK